MMLIVDCGSVKTPFIEEAVDLSMDYEKVGLSDLTMGHFEGKKGIVLSGSPILLTEVDCSMYIDKYAFLKEVDIPLLGICFGHQLIGLLYGAFPARQKEDRDWQVIETLEETALFNRLPTEFEMMEDHCESISLPKQFKLAATSDACVNEAMFHESKLIFGVQFHPEVSGNLGTVLIDNFCQICLSVKSI